MNRAWLIASTVAVLGWYLIVVPRKAPEPLALRVLVLPHDSTHPAGTDVVVHIDNNRVNSGVPVAACGNGPKLTIFKRVDGTWHEPDGLRSGCRSLITSTIPVQRGRSISWHLVLKEPGEYRISAQTVSLARGEFRAAGYISGEPFTIP